MSEFVSWKIRERDPSKKSAKTQIEIRSWREVETIVEAMSNKSFLAEERSASHRVPGMMDDKKTLGCTIHQSYKIREKSYMFP